MSLHSIIRAFYTLVLFATLLLHCLLYIHEPIKAKHGDRQHIVDLYWTGLLTNTHDTRIKLCITLYW